LFGVWTGSQAAICRMTRMATSSSAGSPSRSASRNAPREHLQRLTAHRGWRPHGRAPAATWRAVALVPHRSR
jgi:hypothetical protein